MRDNIIVIFEVLIRQFIWQMMPARRTQEIRLLRNELQALKRSANNPRWGARRIVGDLRRLGRIISKSTVLNILKASGCPSGGPRHDRSWYRLVHSHGKRFFACDFLTCDITLYRTPPGMPNCNAFIERWNRCVREELLDHRIVFGERDLRSLLKEYVEYFYQNRPHRSLDLPAV